MSNGEGTFPEPQSQPFDPRPELIATRAGRVVKPSHRTMFATRESFLTVVALQHVIWDTLTVLELCFFFLFVSFISYITSLKMVEIVRLFTFGFPIYYSKVHHLINSPYLALAWGPGLLLGCLSWCSRFVLKIHNMRFLSQSMFRSMSMNVECVRHLPTVN